MELAPLPLLCCHNCITAISHACPSQGELAVPVCIVLLRRRYLIGTPALITFGYPGYVNSVWVWGGFLVRRWNLQDKAGAVPILQFIWHIRPFRFGSALRVVLVNNLASLYLSITHNKCLFCGIPPFLRSSSRQKRLLYHDVINLH